MQNKKSPNTIRKPQVKPGAADKKLWQTVAASPKGRGRLGRQLLEEGSFSRPTELVERSALDGLERELGGSLDRKWGRVGYVGYGLPHQEVVWYYLLPQDSVSGLQRRNCGMPI